MMSESQKYWIYKSNPHIWQSKTNSWYTFSTSVSSPECVLQLLQAAHTPSASRWPLLSVRRSQLQLLHLTLQLLHLRLEQLHRFHQPEQRNQSHVVGCSNPKRLCIFIWNRWSTSRVLPLDLLLGRPVVQNQFAVALLQLSGRHVQLLVHFSMLVVDLPEEVHLLRQVLEETQSTSSAEISIIMRHPVYYYYYYYHYWIYSIFSSFQICGIKLMIKCKVIKSIGNYIQQSITLRLH